MGIEKVFHSFKTDLQVKKAINFNKSSGIRGAAVIIEGQFVTSPKDGG